MARPVTTSDVLRHLLFICFVSVTFLPDLSPGDSSAWHQWWSYDGISGPAFWGVLNPRWRMCRDGKRQSPINIELKKLLYDVTLKHITISGHSASGVLRNTGSGVTVAILDSSARNIYVTSGPLSYTYKLRHIQFRFSALDGLGSEHRVDDVAFPAELQLYFYNHEIYPNITVAGKSPYGVAAISVFIQTGAKTHQAFDELTKHIARVSIRGQQHPVNIVDIRRVLPNVTSYVTYRGSHTEPSCLETVTWIVLNRPIYVTKQQLSAFYQLNKGGPANPTMILEHNNRQPMALNKRPVRTNINLGHGCGWSKKTHYKVNVFRKH